MSIVDRMGSTLTCFIVSLAMPFSVHGQANYTGDNLFVSEDGGETWSLVPDRPTRLMPQRGVLASDGTLYITYGDGAGPHGHWAVPEPFDNGAVWKLDTSTHTWTDITPSGFTRPFGGVTVDPDDPRRVLISTINTWMDQGGSGGPWGDRFLLSTDGGETWRDVVGDGNGLSVDQDGIPWVEGHAIHWSGSIEFDPFNASRVFVTSGNGIFMTEDLDEQHTTWKFTVRGLEETVPLEIVSVPDGPMISVIGDYDGFVHHDVTEYPEIHQPQTGTTNGLAFAAQQPELVVRSGGQLYYSEDTGETWAPMSKPAGHYNQGRLALSADGNVLLWAPGNSNNTYRTTDRGENWMEVSGVTDNSARPVADPVNAEYFYMYNPSGGGSFLMSRDGGLSFLDEGTPGGGLSRIIRAAPDREGDIWLAGPNAGLYRWVESNGAFQFIEGIDAARAVGFGREAPDADYPAIYIWGTIDSVTGIFRSIDEGETWERINDDDHQYGGPGNAQIVTGDANIFGRVYMTTVGRGIAYGDRDEDDEYTWDIVRMGGAGYVTAVITTRAEENLIYARTDVGGAYRWNEDNQSWRPLTDWIPESQVGLMGIESLAIDPQNPGRVYMLAGTSYWSGGFTAILRSDDYGETFDVIDVTNQFRAHGNGIGRQNGERLVVDPNKSDILWVGTRWNGLFRSTDRGSTWERVSSLDVSTTPNENGISFLILDGTSVADGATQKIYAAVSVFSDEEPTTIDEPVVAERFQLEQNYPNPFNPATSIRYMLPEVSSVTITVFDALGRRVATPVRDDVQAAGRHEILFDAGSLPSGMYLYRLDAGEFSKTGRMMLIR